MAGAFGTASQFEASRAGQSPIPLLSGASPSESSYVRAEIYTPKPPFVLHLKPWLLQAALMVCVTRGTIPFFQDANADVYGSGGGVSGTTIFILVTIVWIIATLLTMTHRSAAAITTDRLLLLSLPVLAIASTSWSVAPRITAGMGFQLFLLTLLGISIAYTYSLEEQMQLFMITGAIAGVASLLAAVISPATAFDHFGHTGALQGIFTHKNTCGSFMLLLFTPALFLRRLGSHGHFKTFAYGLFCAAIVVLSQSRTSMLLFAFVLLLTGVFGVLKYFRNRDALFIAVMLGVMTTPVLLLIAANWGTLAEALGKDSTFSGRTFVWQAVLLCIARRPWLGYGYMAFFSSRSAGAGDLSTSLGFSVNHAHNGFLMVGLDLGLAGLVIVALILFHAICNTGRLWVLGLGRKVEWYVLLIVLVVLSNIDERGLASANDLSWLLFVVACAGLCRLAREASSLNSRSAELANSDSPVQFRPIQLF